MTATVLGLYNDALTHLGERRLASLSENREPRRKLDVVYAQVLDECLQSGYWKHARRTIKMTNPAVTPAFGYKYAFDMPSDCLQIYLVSQSPDSNPPMNNWVFETGFVRADYDTLYVTYLSNDAIFGGRFDHWSPLFARWVSAALAARIAFAITQDRTLTESIEKKARTFKRAALSRDAANGPPRNPPMGSWMQSRRRAGDARGGH